VNGKLIASYLLAQGVNQLEINTAGWTNGVYTYSIEIDGVNTEHRKMVLIRN
jgi:hypothetical protein